MGRYKHVYSEEAGRSRPEHILVWEQANGPLPEGWVIHHLNGNGHDNRLENLQAMPKGEHTKLHNQLKKEGREVVDATDPDVIADRERTRKEGRRHYAAHRDEELAKDAVYRATHHEACCERSRAYYAKNRERCRASQAEYEATHKEERTARNAEYAATHKEERKAYQKTYAQENPDKIAGYRQKYQETHKDDIEARRILHKPVHRRTPDWPELRREATQRQLLR